MTLTERPFAARLKEALVSGSSASIDTLLGEAELTSLRAVNEAAAAKRRALDPLLDDADIEAARKEATDAEFLQARMVEATRLLIEKRETFTRAEDQVRRRKVYEAAVAKRDAAAERLKEYPALANAIGAILAEVLAADQAVIVANTDLSIGAEWLAMPEAMVRGALPIGGTPPLPLTRVVLPALAHGRPRIFGATGFGISNHPVFNPEPTNTEVAGPDVASARADGAGEATPASSSVRLVPRMVKGEAA